MRPTRVYVVANFEPLRVGLVVTIQASPDFEVVGQSDSITEMITERAHLTTDVLIIDIAALSRTDLERSYKAVGEALPALKVLFLGTAQDARAITLEAIPLLMRLDTIGFLLKDGAVERVLQALPLIATGAFVVESDLIKRVLTRLSQGVSYDPSESNEHLSDRETEVLRMVVRGRSNKEIARELLLSEGTIKAHVNHIMVKIGVDRRADLVRQALTSGMVRINDDDAP